LIIIYIFIFVLIIYKTLKTSTKIVLNKKNANDEFGILSIQSFVNGKKIKKSIGIRATIDDFNSDFFFQFKRNYIKRHQFQIK